MTAAVMTGGQYYNNKMTLMTVDDYLHHKRRWEALLWLLFIIWQVSANVFVAIYDTQGTGHQVWEPVVWEVSSIVTFLMLIPLLLSFDRRYPIHFVTLKKHLPLHVLATIPFSLIHVVIMVALRELGYWLMGSDYDFGHWGQELLYEYAKDFRTYFYLLIIIYLYRLILFRAQGEASILDESETQESETPSTEQQIKQHLLVKKLGKEFLIKVDEIEWLEACGNYVNLHVSGRAYPYRGTMKYLEAQLDNDQFLRVHRSYMVNYAQIQSIEPLESGDARIQLHQGQELPFSRRYRADLKQR